MRSALEALFGVEALAGGEGLRQVGVDVPARGGEPVGPGPVAEDDLSRPSAAIAPARIGIG